MHEQQKLFDDAWKDGGEKIATLFSLAQRYQNGSEYKLAAECYRNAAMAYKHETFRIRTSNSRFEERLRLKDRDIEVHRKWVAARMYENPLRYPIKIASVNISTIDAMIKKATNEPLLANEMDYLESISHESLRRTLIDVIYAAFGIMPGGSYLLRLPKVRVAVDPIVDYIFALATRTEWLRIDQDRGKAIPVTRSVR